MKILPSVKIDRLEQIKPGELFIFLHDGGSCFALMAQDPKKKGETAILPLDPTGASLLQTQVGTTVSFGKDYIIKLPSAQDAWVERDPLAFCLAVTTEQVYFRPKPGSPFGECLVQAADGVILQVWPPIVAYALEWEIAIRDDALGVQTIFKYPPPKGSS
jgi:hypothetical protein